MFNQLFPNLKIHPCVASIIHIVPVMRDIAHWAGVIDVTRSTLHYMLGEKKESVQVVIGGMKEMFMSKSWKKEIAIVRGKRKGIFQLAIRHGTPMMPAFSFGETYLMDNVDFPLVQNWFKDHVGIPLPFIPRGRWGIPMPRRNPVTVAFGDCILPPCGKKDNPTTEEVLEFQKVYFEELERVFEDNKCKAGHDYHCLEFIDD